MRPRDDLIAAFGRSMPARVAEATELWLGFEQGNANALPALRRLLHTVKGEAHMLELSQCAELAEGAESVVEALRKAAVCTPLTGDALLGAFEALGLVSVPSEDDPPDIGEVLQTMRAAIEGLQLPPGPLEAAADAPPGRNHDLESRTSGGPSAPHQRVSIDALKAEDVRPLVHEMKRLCGEATVLHERLREAHRMLRALLVEIDPRQNPEQLADRIAKTIGYGFEVERRLAGVRAEWSANEFAIGLAMDELDQAVRRASVVSTEHVLNQVRRVARSTARALNKEIDLHVHGDVILDAGVAQRIEPALLHLVRNAIDHGIEAEATRRDRGKPARGSVDVSIRQTESSVTAEVIDDGGGIDFDRLREVLAPRVPNAAALAPEDLLPYLFEQGVTTSDHVSPISGRGVGLDVVAREVGAIGGEARIESRSGAGTRVVLHMPATLRGELAVPVGCRGDLFAFPARAVRSVIRLDHIERTAGDSWVRVHEDSGKHLVRVFSLAALFGHDDQPRKGQAALILYYSSGLFAVTVESYDNPRTITVERTEELPLRSPMIRGVSPMPNGGILLLLDVESLYALARGHVALGMRQAQTTARGGPPCALVVEDAPVARELLCGILRSLGLRVQEAIDGRQGLLAARADPPDVVLTDIEMPYMDGIEMVTHLRNSDTFAHTAVIVLTTATNEQNVAQFQSLGVAGIISKQHFVESELRELIDRCLKMSKSAMQGRDS